jgi:predicted esterase
MIAQAIWDVVEEIKRTNKKIILVGFSIGAAFGLKMLEFLEGI